MHLLLKLKLSESNVALLPMPQKTLYWTGGCFFLSHEGLSPEPHEGLSPVFTSGRTLFPLTLVSYSQIDPILLCWSRWCSFWSDLCCVWWHSCLLCSRDVQTMDVAWRVHRSLPGYHAGSQGGEAGSCSEQSSDGTGSGIQIWNTLKSPALNWTHADLVEAFQSSDVMSFMASLCMQTLCLYSEPCLTLPSFFPFFTSCMDHTPAFSVWAEGKRSLLSSLTLPISPLLSAPGISSSSRFQSCVWVLKMVKAVCPTTAGRC